MTLIPCIAEVNVLQDLSPPFHGGLHNDSVTLTCFIWLSIGEARCINTCPFLPSIISHIQRCAGREMS